MFGAGAAPSQGQVHTPQATHRGHASAPHPTPRQTPADMHSARVRGRARPHLLHRPQAGLPLRFARCAGPRLAVRHGGPAQVGPPAAAASAAARRRKGVAEHPCRRPHRLAEPVLRVGVGRARRLPPQLLQLALRGWGWGWRMGWGCTSVGGMAVLVLGWCWGARRDG